MRLPRPLPEPLVERLSRDFDALGDPVRMRILDVLERTGERNVQALVDELGLSQQNVSKHLRVLHRAGIVRRRKEGRTAWYRLTDPLTLAVYEQAAEALIRRLRKLKEEP